MAIADAASATTSAISTVSNRHLMAAAALAVATAVVSVIAAASVAAIVPVAIVVVVSAVAIAAASPAAVAAALAVAAAVPVAWEYVLHDYQKARVETFLDPASDALGAGWNITQAKIAIGSGGVTGKGFLQGTQSRLNFLPEKQTDFIFTMLSEELGFVGGLTLLAFYSVVLIFSFSVAIQCRNQFGRLLALGIAVMFFFYVFINTAMVMGLLPVVGVPLPLVSYGGTAMLSLMFAFGLLMSVYIHRNVEIARSPSAFW